MIRAWLAFVAVPIEQGQIAAHLRALALQVFAQQLGIGFALLDFFLRWFEIIPVASTQL